MTRSPRTRRMTPLRAAAAAAVALLTAAGLSGCTIIQHLEGSGGGAGAAVPSDVAENVRPYYEQQLEWTSCESGLECATVTAPMNWDDPSQGDISLAAVRIPASGTKLGSLFTNPGGPGASGYDFVALSGTSAFSQDLLQSYDIVGWDPRGVGRSTAVDCYDDKGMDEYFYGVPSPKPKDDAAYIQYATDQAKKFADACLEKTGPMLEFVDTMSTVHDLDLLRALVGDEKLNYFGFSYGTDIGAHYADTYPQRVGRLVLDGATDPTLSQFDVVLAQQAAFGDATKAYLTDCLAKPQTCPFHGSVDDAIAQINDIMKKADDRQPKAADGRVLTSSVIDTAISAALYDESSWRYLSDAFRTYTKQGDPSGFFMLSDFYYDRDENGHYTSNMFEAFIAINCLDYPVENDPAKIEEYNRKLAEATPIGLPGPKDMGDVQCQQWPFQSRVTPHAVTGAGAQPILVVGTTGDPATPIEWAQAVSQQLESGVLLTYEGEGHIAYDSGDPCVVGAVDHYLLTGEPPADDTKC